MKNAGQIQEADEQTKLNLEELMRKYDTESRFRILSGWQGKLVALIAVAMSCFHFYTSGFGLLLAQKQGAVHLAFTLALVFLLYPASSKQSKTSGIPFYDFILGAIGVASALYLVRRGEYRTPSFPASQSSRCFTATSGARCRTCWRTAASTSRE